MTIPDECSLAICIMAVGLGGFSPERLRQALLLMLLSALIMGFGDAKMLSALCLLLGDTVLFVIAAAYACSFIYCAAALTVSHFSKSFSLHLCDRIAFAPFIAPPAIAALANHLV